MLSFFCIGDLQPLSGVDRIPHLEVPYPLTNGGQQLRRTLVDVVQYISLPLHLFAVILSTSIGGEFVVLIVI